MQNTNSYVAEEDLSLPHSLRRSVWLLRDMESELPTTADNELDDKSEDLIISMRATLTAAYRSGKPKYVCAHCLQPLGLKIRNTRLDFFPFFAHYQDRDVFCPIKERNEVDPTRTVIDSEAQFKESALHRNMVEKLEEVIRLCHNFSKIQRNKLISTPAVIGFRRPSLYSKYRENIQVCYDALVGNPQIGLLVDRNAFYKMQGMFYMWIFPDFSTRYQVMCQKDILYMNRRNVFVFDSAEYYKELANRKYLSKTSKFDASHRYAYEESIRQGRLMLNCYWQIPVVKEDGFVAIEWIGPKLVAFDDLTFDMNTFEVFYHDSDQDFYHSYSPEKQALIDKWMAIKRDRWNLIFESIRERKERYERLLARRERRERLAYYYPLIESGEFVPVPFQDGATKLWGYRVNDLNVILPAFFDAKPFSQGYAWVRKKKHWGLIDYKGNGICKFVYSDIADLSGGFYSGKIGIVCDLINSEGRVVGTFDELCSFVDGCAKAKKIYRRVREYANPF